MDEWIEHLLPEHRARVLALKRAIGNASEALDPPQGSRPDYVTAYQWLRTTFPKDHPNYVDPDSLPPGYYNERYEHKTD